MMNVQEIVSYKQPHIYTLQSGIKELNNNIEFKNTLQLLLAWGNHMNYCHIHWNYLIYLELKIFNLRIEKVVMSNM